jgi:predicted nicotinamide N-methyase
MDALVVAGRRFLLHRHPDIDELVDAIDVLDEDERIPYWAELWPSSIALAQFLLQHPAQVLGLRAIELGCGLGLAGLAAAAAGARVLATDYDRDAVRFARRNAQANGLAVSHALMDWRQPIARGTFPIVLAADILYEGRFLVPVWRALDALLTPRGSALVSEPGREVAQPFFDLLRREGWRVKRETVEKVANGKAPPAVVTVWRVQRPAG